MSRHPDIDLDDDRRDAVELRDLVDRPSRFDLVDGCTGTPWCACWDCERVPAGGHFAHSNPVDDYGIEEW